MPYFWRMQLNAQNSIDHEVPGIRKKQSISEQTAFFTHFINFSCTFPRKSQLIFYGINVSKVKIK